MHSFGEKTQHHTGASCCESTVPMCSAYPWTPFFKATHIMLLALKSSIFSIDIIYIPAWLHLKFAGYILEIHFMHHSNGSIHKFYRSAGWLSARMRPLVQYQDSKLQMISVQMFQRPCNGHKGRSQAKICWVLHVFNAFHSCRILTYELFAR